MIKTAQYFDKDGQAGVVCRLCPAECHLQPGKAGICRNRFNQDGMLVTDNYGELVTIAIDPIEKKPLYHFYPGRDILSTGPNGCNLGCVHCQNWTISQKKVQTSYVAPAELVQTARQHGSMGIAFTYTEPLIWFEYIMDVAPLLRDQDMKVVLVSNGYINEKPLRELLPMVDAANIDLKGISPEFYAKYCKGKLQPVLDTIRIMSEAGVHLELTNLIIPGQNDSDEDLKGIADFVASVNDSIPLHFSAYHPDYKASAPATPLETMLKAREIALSRLKYVYVGNIVTESGSNTYCPGCGALLIERSHYFTSIRALSGSKCEACGFDTGIIQ
ncbi:MAG: AmmeMemoRadiSam system radical SAM enzyme [Candidatus Zixiibacteriota bacterium]